MNWLRQIVVTASLALLGASCTAYGQNLYVSTRGDDAASGSLQHPLKTFDGAEHKVLQLKQAGQLHGPVDVVFEAGRYDLPNPVVFGPQDSGTAASPITYEAQSGAKVVLSGGTLLHLHWRHWRGAIMRAKVPSDFTFDQIWVNGNKQMLARFPVYQPLSHGPWHGSIERYFSYKYAKRWASIMGLLNQIHQHTSESYYSHGQWPPTCKGRLFAWPAAKAISPKFWRLWKHPDGGIIQAMHPYGWGSLSFVIKRINGRLMVVGGWQNNRPVGNMPNTGVLENFRCYLQHPGEWCLEHHSRTLYYWPPAGVNLATAAVEAAHLRSLVRFEGAPSRSVKYITLKGFTMEHARETFMRTREPIMRSDWALYRGGAVYMDGAQHCDILNCNLEDLGGNAIFVSNYNRNITIKGCLICDIGANAICFVGNPHAAQVPEYWGIAIPLRKMNMTPGPKTPDYPADCLVDDCLIHNIGRIEYQTAGVEIDLAENITVRHCSIYNTPRAGINIGDGCWGGDVVEYCDVFNNVLHTGDNGSFNGWGRDRYWGHPPSHIEPAVKLHPDLPFLDVVKPITLRNNRWQCSRGWDIDLDDGCTNYRIYNNLCLSGGIKNREGYRRIVTNNIILHNTFYPQVWFTNCQEKFQHNIVMRPYRYVQVPSDWPNYEDYNLFPTRADLSVVQKLGADRHSLAGNPMFIDPAAGNYDVAPGSPALRIGFKNFPMNEFGVTSPRLKALSQAPLLAGSHGPQASKIVAVNHPWLGATVRNITDLAEQSVYGLPSPSGVLVTACPMGSFLYRAGLRVHDVIIGANRIPIKRFRVLAQLYVRNPRLVLHIMRSQQPITLVIKK